MTIAAVAATLIQTGAGSSVSANVSATAGNSLIVGGAMFGSASWTVTRTGDTFTTDTNGDNVNQDGQGIASAPNVTGGSVSCTISCTSATAISGWAFEVSGPPTSAIRDATSPAMATGTSTTPTSNALTNATASALYVSVFGNDAGATTVSPGSGWTNVVGSVTMAATNGAAFMVGGLEYQIVSTTASRTASWTTGSSVAWASGIAVYKDGGAAAAQVPYNPWPQRAPLLAS